jgi:NAD(P)H-hydrate epimerase
MQLLNTSQIHAWDEYTIRHEPITSIELMERAAGACYDWLMNSGYKGKSFSIFCGKGNNGGDGLAIARMLAVSGHTVNVYILEFGHLGTNDFQQNLGLLHGSTATIYFISSESAIYPVQEEDVIIDALLGSGLNRPLEGLTAALVHHINNSGHDVISIDVPTGLYTDKHPEGNVVVRATHTLSFQSHKLSFLLKESQPFIGELHILDIGLDPQFLSQTESVYHLVDHPLVNSILRHRQRFSHKGDYGTGALIAGSTGMMGAAALCARAFMRSGAGKLICHVPKSGYAIMQVGVPEAMVMIEGEDYVEKIGSLEKYDAVGIGPGLGKHDGQEKLFSDILRRYRQPLVIDADGLNILARHPKLLKQLPPFSVLTPHVGEFERLFGSFKTDFERIESALVKARELDVLIVLKGPYTFIATPGGKGYFNSTGNPGMATGGSGDVLTGFITGLICQGYPSEHAAIAGVYLHGLAGDLAAAANSQASLIATDLVNYFGQAFRSFE